jgi:ribulose-5-phosphate 4-epimerase/fuculose-1-phosphate aldolase
MMEQEGVIKYSLDFQRQALNASHKVLSEINACRSLMIGNGLLGQDEDRYGGYGFGNISKRRTESNTDFLISGSQTGHEHSLSNASLSCITDINIEQNTLRAYGEIEPSSESMTHGVLYQISDRIQAVIHVHSPDIWRNAEVLNLASTAKDIPYGTPEMARAVQQLSSERMLGKAPLPILFVMKGHEDGVVAAGESLTQCTNILLNTLQQSKQIA